MSRRRVPSRKRPGTDAGEASKRRLRIGIAREDDSIVVALHGDLDVYVAADARAHLDEAIERAVSHSIERVVIDASGVGFCDSTGLSMLVLAHEIADRRGVQLSVRRVSEPLRDLLHLTGLDVLLDS